MKNIVRNVLFPRNGKKTCLFFGYYFVTFRGRWGARRPIMVLLLEIHFVIVIWLATYVEFGFRAGFMIFLYLTIPESRFWFLGLLGKCCYRESFIRSWKGLSGLFSQSPGYFARRDRNWRDKPTQHGTF